MLISPRIRRLTAYVCLALLGVDTAACYHNVERVPAEVASRASGHQMIPVEAFVLTNGDYRDVHGQFVWLSGDTLYAQKANEATYAYPLASVRSVSVRELDGRRTAWTVAGITVGALLVLAAIGWYEFAHSCMLCGINWGTSGVRAPR